MEKQDIQQIEKCKQGDAYAREWAYKKYAPMMLGISQRYIRDRMQAEDIMHESFVMVFEKIGQLKQNSHFAGWVKKIVVNNALTHLKKQLYYQNVDETTVTADEEKNEEPADIKEQILEQDITKENMLALINELPVGFRSVFNLYVFEKLKHHEISEQLGISVGTSKSQLQRARKLLQKKLYHMATERRKIKERETVVFSALLITMDNDLNYIDKLAQNTLQGYAPQPLIYHVFTGKVTASAAHLTSIGLKTKLLGFISQNIWTLATVATLVSAGSFLLLKQEPKKEVAEVKTKAATYSPQPASTTKIKTNIIQPTKNTNENNVTPITNNTTTHPYKKPVKNETIKKTVTDTVQVVKKVMVTRKVIVRQQDE